MSKELSPTADLVLRIMAVSKAWGFEAIDETAITQAFEILEPLLAAPTLESGGEKHE